MKKHSSFFIRALIATTCCCAGVHAAETYQASLQAGDKLQGENKYDDALGEYDTAKSQATTNTERSLALGKQALIYAFQKKDYGKASELAKSALDASELKPVAKVIALQALSECQMKQDKDFAAASQTLGEALALDNIDWIRPTLTMSLGDAYRLSGKSEQALDVYGTVPSMPEISNKMKGIAYLNMGLTYQYSLKDQDKARDAYAKAVEFLPTLKDEIEGHTSRMH